jgi:hypothetical protein
MDPIQSKTNLVHTFASLKMQFWIIIIINTNCNWAYARWQCYINVNT